MPSLQPLQGSLNLLLVVSVTNTSFAALLAGSLLLLLFDSFHDRLHAVLLDGWLGGSVFLLLVDGLPNGWCAVLLDGWLAGAVFLLLVVGLPNGTGAVLLDSWHNCRLVGSPITSACQ